MGEYGEQILIDKMFAYYPFIEKHQVHIDIDKYDRFKVIVQLDDGMYIEYNGRNNVCRKLPSKRLEMTKKETMSEFGIRLYDILWRKGLTQSDLAEMTGIAQPALSKYITGKAMPSFHTVDKIAKALNCSVDEFRYV